MNVLILHIRTDKHINVHANMNNLKTKKLLTFLLHIFLQFLRDRAHPGTLTLLWLTVYRIFRSPVSHIRLTILNWFERGEETQRNPWRLWTALGCGWKDVTYGKTTTETSRAWWELIDPDPSSASSITWVSAHVGLPFKRWLSSFLRIFPETAQTDFSVFLT